LPRLGTTSSEYSTTLAAFGSVAKMPSRPVPVEVGLCHCQVGPRRKLKCNKPRAIQFGQNGTALHRVANVRLQDSDSPGDPRANVDPIR
jgi:hypothetical protein